MTYQPIELTDDEVKLLADYLGRTCDVIWDERARGFVDELNKLRAPDPLGTVRADGDGNVAVKTNNRASDQWFVHRIGDARCSSYESFAYLSTWPIVYRPEAE